MQLAAPRPSALPLSHRRCFRRSAGAGPDRLAPTSAGPEVGIWVVISPDDTTTIRIARSEMGQGTLTGLAQLVADELDCRLEPRPHRIRRARGQPRQQARLGRHVHRRQPRHPRLGRLRAQRRRRRPRHADRGGRATVGRACWRMHRRQQRRHPCRQRPHACAMASLPPTPPSCPSRRRQGEDAGAMDDHRQAACKRLDTVDKLSRQADIRHRRAAARTC